MNSFDPQSVPCPAYVIDKGRLGRNLSLLADLKKRCGITVLFAQKAFATPQIYPTLAASLDGVCASGLYEASLGRDAFGKLVHTYSPAYRDDEFEQIARLSDHVVFNSVGQLRLFAHAAKSHNAQLGLRVNPECSVTDTALYDPCAAGSRLGVVASQLGADTAADLDGLHVHALCEKDSHALEQVLAAFEVKFGAIIPQMKWVNLGGGHAFTRGDYNLDHFVELVTGFQSRYPGVEVIIEPGAAVVWQAGMLVASVLDVVHNAGEIAILDISCTCHTPDVLEMPYRPIIRGEVPVEEAPHVYKLGGVSCLAGDVFGTWGFARPLQRGDRIIFEDMAQYSIVKSTMFNGVRHPDIVIWDEGSNTVETIREFSFDDYKHRMG